MGDVRANNATFLRGSVYEITTFEEAFVTGCDEHVHDSSAVGNFGRVSFFFDPHIPPEAMKQIVPDRFNIASSTF